MNTPHSILYITLALLAFTACSDPTSPDHNPSADASSDTQSDTLDASQDPPDSAPDALDEVGLCDLPIDIFEDVPPNTPPIRQPIELHPQDATPTLGASLQPNLPTGDAIHLPRGGEVSWTLPDAFEGQEAAVEIRALVWRHEATRIHLQTTDTEDQHGHLWNAFGAVQWSSVVAPIIDDQRGFGADFEPVHAVVKISPRGAFRIRMPLDGADAWVYAVRLLPSDTAEVREGFEGAMEEPLGTPSQAVTRVEVAPCEQEGCDDAESIREAIQTLPQDGSAVLSLAEGSYTFRSRVVIARSNTVLEGRGADRTEILWDPAEAFGSWDAAIVIQGPSAGAQWPLVEAVEEGQSTLWIEPLEERPEVGSWVELSADDFGEIPALCAFGRDEERALRHVTWVGRVVEVVEEEGRVGVRVDRQTSHAIPTGAAPRLSAFRAVHGSGVRGVSIRGMCPEAEEKEPFTQDPVACSNTFVWNHSAVRFVRSVGGFTDGVWSYALGRGGVEVTSSFETTIRGGGMSKPAHYGSGGRGYGVHIIRSGRTRVVGYETVQARHGVVVDFGSTESHIVGCRATLQSLAALDVHGESSYDSLMLGNVLEENGIGVVVGGGGRQVHCDDGPRHAIVRNRIVGSSLYGVQLTDYSKEIDVEYNTVDGALVGATVNAGSRDILMLGNAFRRSLTTHVQITEGEHGTGPVQLVHNVYDGDPERRAAVDEDIDVHEDGVWMEER